MNFGLTGTDSVVLEAVINSPTELYQAQIVALLNMHKATVYLSLRRMERNGFITSREESPESKQHRPGMPRRFYKPTRIGKRLYTLQVDTQAFLLAAR